MPRPGPVSESALRFLGLLRQWEEKCSPFALRVGGRRGAARLADELGEIRRLTARMAIGAAELALPVDTAGAEEALRALLVRLRETDAVAWPRVIEIVNDVAQATVRRAK